MFEALDLALTQRGMDSIKMLLGETANFRHLYEKSPTLRTRFEEEEGANETPDNQIETFFDPASPCYIGDLTHLPRLIAGHGYHTDLTNRQIKEARENVRRQAEKYGIDFIQSEWCLLPGVKDPLDGFPEDWKRGNYAGMDVALHLGRLVYADFVYAHSKAWGYWKAMEVNGSHALISLFPKDGNIINGGLATANKLLWGLGNYSFFIRPGYLRIALSGANDLDTIVGTAWQSPDQSRIVAVYVNSAYHDCPIKTSFPQSAHKSIRHISVYTTNSRMDLAKTSDDHDKNEPIKIPCRSIVTVVYELKQDS
jgi:hypothetical protein